MKTCHQFKIVRAEYEREIGFMLAPPSGMRAGRRRSPVRSKLPRRNSGWPARSTVTSGAAPSAAELGKAPAQSSYP